MLAQNAHEVTKIPKELFYLLDSHHLILRSLSSALQASACPFRLT